MKFSVLIGGQSHEFETDTNGKQVRSSAEVDVKSVIKLQ